MAKVKAAAREALMVPTVGDCGADGDSGAGTIADGRAGGDGTPRGEDRREDECFLLVTG